MTYTTTYKDYEAATFDVAAGDMLKDPEVWAQLTATPEEVHPLLAIVAEHEYRHYGSSRGDQAGYMVERWEWHQEERRLRVWFR